MPTDVQLPEGTTAAPAHRLDVQLHDLLMKPPETPRLLPPPPTGKEQTLPTPVFPQHPELMTARDEDYFPKPGERRTHSMKRVYRAMRGWAFPWIRSRVLPGDFHPIIAYLFNEWKCNLDCHYCWAFDNSVRGMTEDTAKRSIDWLRDTGAGVLALMGGEPLLRPDFAHKIIYYAVKKGFWVYLPTNGRLMWPKVIDKVADAGVGVVNLAVDAWDDVPGRGLPKAMVPIRSHFDYLVKKQYKYGYSVFLNINICANNMDDVRMLTELAHDNGIATDYHICESPMTEQPHFKHLYSNPTFIREEHHPAATELIDWLIDKQNSGYHMVNSVERLAQMKNFVQGELARLGLPRGTQLPDRARRRHPGAVLPHVLGRLRLGHHREPQVRNRAAQRDEERVPEKLLFHSEPHSRLLLQRQARDRVVAPAGEAWLQKGGRQLRGLAGRKAALWVRRCDC